MTDHPTTHEHILTCAECYELESEYIGACYEHGAEFCGECNMAYGNRLSPVEWYPSGGSDV